jgi:hypothetical protein
MWAAYEKARQVINSATALFVPNGTAVFGFGDERKPTPACLIRDRVKAGARLLVEPRIVNADRAVDQWNGFLAPYDMAVSTWRICSREGNTLDCAATNKLSIVRSAQSFRNPELFQGVDQVRLDSPFAMWYFRDSLPVLLATVRELPIDAATDFLPRPEPKPVGDALPSEWNARELSCMLVWHGQDRGAVMASTGPVLHDPGIQENRRLAKNLVEWLFAYQSPLSCEERWRRIEVNLVDFVLGVVKVADKEWWTRIPLQIRQKCAQRQEEENCYFPKEAYFDVIDFKTIMSKEWDLFKEHLRAVGCEVDRGKDKSLSWLDRLNEEIRRLVGHPSKKHVAGYEFSTEEREFLRHCDELVRKLVKRIDRPNWKARQSAGPSPASAGNLEAIHRAVLQGRVES